MSYGILDKPVGDYKKDLIVKTAICAAVLFTVLILNVLLTFFRTETTHTAFLTINILSDIIVFSFLFFFVGTNILLRKRLYALACRAGNGAKITGEIIGVSDFTETINRFECRELSLQLDEVKKVFIVEDGAIPSDLGGRVRLTVVDNIVVEAEVVS